MSEPVLDSMRVVIAGQFQSGLAMFRKAIELCPERLWLAGEPNRYWHLAYHGLFYLHFYLSVDDKSFVPWERHREGYNYLGEMPLQPGIRAKADEPYTRDEMLEYAAFCREWIETRMAVDDLEASESGFPWIPLSRVGMHLYNLRHLAHHGGQLADRLRSGAGVGVGWVR